MSRLTRGIVVALSAVVFLYVAIGYTLGRTQEDRSYGSLTVYGEVLAHIQDDYVEDANMATVTTGALHGLLDSLDAQSAYLSPKEYADYKQKAEMAVRNSVGAALSKRFGYVVVVSVLPDSPAEKAGLREGDVLESIAGFTTRLMSIGQAEALLAGEPGTSVKVSVVRRGNSEPQEMDIVRARFSPPKPVEEQVNSDIAYLRVSDFAPGTAENIREKLIQLQRQGPHKLILDLRMCAFGEIREAVSTAQLFLPSGTIATLRGRTISSETFSADPVKVVWKEPVTVLISSSTSGAAELVASAIADNHRGDTVGERTFGSASEQKTIPLEDGAALILTVGEYYTPAGKSILDDGVTPTVPESSDDLALLNPTYVPPAVPSSSPDDPVMKRAIELLQNGNAAKKAA